MNTKHILASAITAALAFFVAAHADHTNNSFNFKPIKEPANAADWNASAPWKLPEGFTQTVVSDESDSNIYTQGRNDWHEVMLPGR